MFKVLAAGAMAAVEAQASVASFRIVAILPAVLLLVFGAISG